MSAHSRITALRTALLAACCTFLPALASAQNAPAFAKATPDGRGYTIDYAALGQAAGLSQAEKFQIARALRKGEGHVASGPEDIAGFGGKCHVDTDFKIPVGVGCTLTADPAATKILAGLGTFALTNAICLVIDVEDGEITEPICDLVLEAIVQSTLEPIITQCADQGQTTEIKVDIKILPKPKASASAKCT